MYLFEKNDSRRTEHATENAWLKVENQRLQRKIEELEKAVAEKNKDQKAQHALTDSLHA